LEIIPTGYLLIDGGKETAVQRVSQTQPIEQDNIELAYKTAKAGEFLGKKLIYLEAGSGANQHVSLDMIRYVAQNIEIPLIVGGGIRSMKTIQEIYNAGADLVVIGTAFENDNNFFSV
jgi:phosphoglycerol geranylgeranyltransferase